MAKLTKNQVIEALKAAGVLFIDPDASYNALYALLKEQEPKEEEEAVVDDTPKIVPSKHAAMCGQATADNHEERIRDIEKAVAYLLAQ